MSPRMDPARRGAVGRRQGPPVAPSWLCHLCGVRGLGGRAAFTAHYLRAHYRENTP